MEDLKYVASHLGQVEKVNAFLYSLEAPLGRSEVVEIRMTLGIKSI